MRTKGIIESICVIIRIQINITQKVGRGGGELVVMLLFLPAKRVTAPLFAPLVIRNDDWTSLK